MDTRAADSWQSSIVVFRTARHCQIHASKYRSHLPHKRFNGSSHGQRRPVVRDAPETVGCHCPRRHVYYSSSQAPCRMGGSTIRTSRLSRLGNGRTGTLFPVSICLKFRISLLPTLAHNTPIWPRTSTLLSGFELSSVLHWIKSNRSCR
jgi:hypothetical protein